MPKNDGKKRKWGMAACACAGVAVSALAAALLFALVAMFVVSGKIPQGTMKAIAVAAAFAVSFAGSAVAVRMYKEKALMAGMVCVLCLCGMSLVFTAFSASGVLLGGTNLMFLAAFIAGGLLTCVIRRKRSVKRRVRR